MFDCMVATRGSHGTSPSIRYRLTAGYLVLVLSGTRPSAGYLVLVFFGTKPSAGYPVWYRPSARYHNTGYRRYHEVII